MTTTLEDIRVNPAVQKTYSIARKKIEQHELKKDLVRFVFNTLRLRGVVAIKLGEKAVDLGYPDIIFSVQHRGCAVWIGKRDFKSEDLSVEMRKNMNIDWDCLVMKTEGDFMKFMENKR